VDAGFKYLGFYIKPNCYNRVDWIWLEKKFEKIIVHWTHKWLSLGGRVTLVKAVLESISVYWLSLAKIPKGVPNSIRRRMFSFMWTCKKDKEGFHLISWKRISKPKKNGGWGIKNIFTFGKALVAKSLWKCLMLSGFWHEVIFKKYLQKKSVEAWLRQENKSWDESSNFCRALTSSLPVVSAWLVWKPGNGKAVRLGTDPMVGTYNFYKLSKQIIMALKDQGLHFLARAGVNIMEDVVHKRWLKHENLGLEGELKHDWSNYTKGLSGSGIDLNDEKDLLLWSWDTKRGQVSAKLAYNALLLEERVEAPMFWYTKLWKWKLPLKVQLFIWLMLE
jgi:hypothetical protein